MPRRSKHPVATTTVADDIKQKRAFATRSEEASVGLLLTADVVRRYGEKLLAPYGITQQQYNVLRILRGSRPDGLPTLEIAARMIEKAPGITRLLDRLERKRLVIRERSPGDRRQVICRISPKGVDLLPSLDSTIRRAIEPVNRLSQKDLKRLIVLLDSVRREYR
ncbi:MAG TPA: MarR family transcriptional regulator [Thermoanaerobaculia bacterium]